MLATMIAMLLYKALSTVLKILNHCIINVSCNNELIIVLPVQGGNLVVVGLLILSMR